MNDNEARVPEMPCAQFVELVTSYLDDALPDGTRATVDEHLEGCEGCRTALAQWRTVIDLAGRLTEADIEGTEPLARDRLMSTFRGLRRR